MALALAGTMVWLRFHAFIPLRSAIRSLACGAAGFLAAYYTPVHGMIGAALALAAGGLSYLATLVLTGELGTTELRAVQQVLGRRARA